MSEKIESILKEAFQISFLNIIDESAKHANHAGAKESGGGHFVVHIVSDDFQGKTLVQRHRMINDALSAEFKSNIHALSITAKTNAEVLP